MLARALSDQARAGAALVRAEELQSRTRSIRILPQSRVQLSLLGSPDGLAFRHEGLSTAIPSGASGLHEAARCSAELFRYALHLYLHRIVNDPLSTGGPSPLVQEAISESLQLLPIIPDTSGPGIFLGWALVVIGAELDALDQREFIIRRLESLTLLSCNHGVLALKVLDEVWRRRDDLNLGRSLCRRLRWQDVMEDMKMDQALV